MTEDDPIVCLCGEVTEDAIVQARRDGCTDLAAIRQATGAGLGCGDCSWDIADLLSMEL